MRSGQDRSCTGPRRYRFHGGAAEWTGCPRLALGQREHGWITTHDRCGGRLSLFEQAAAPLLLLDVFDVLDELEAQKLAHARAVQAEQANPAALR